VMGGERGGSGVVDMLMAMAVGDMVKGK
jgi:hypothetical protein